MALPDTCEVKTIKAKLTHEQAVDLVAEFGNPTSASANSEFSRGAILRALQRPPSVEQDPDVLELHNKALVAEMTELRAINKRLETKLAAAHAKVEDLVEAAYEGAFDAFKSYGAPTILTPATDWRDHSEEVALWCMTDWQGAKLTTSYNSDVMAERVRAFCRKAVHITDIQRSDHPVKKAVITFGGDMIEGLFNFPTQAFEIDQTIFGQFTTVSMLLAEVVRFALENYEEVMVVAEWGNHGRIGSKRDNVPRYDNIDRMCYEMARRMIGDHPRLNWEDCPEDIQRIEVGNYRALLIHGDEVGRNGYASPMTIVNHVNRWRSGAYRWDFRDVYLGHYHTHAEWPMANGLGAVYQTGSIESDNRYALVGMAASATPTQRLHFIDPKRGRVSAQYKVYPEDDLFEPEALTA